MNMPGFTAEEAVKRGSINYTAAIYRTGSANAAIQPQLMKLLNSNCIRGCVCVSPINCPCCESMDPPPPTFP